MGGEAFPAHVLNLPTIVESYKTYDDIHLVKSNDIGQVPFSLIMLMAGALLDPWTGTLSTVANSVSPLRRSCISTCCCSLVCAHTSLHLQTCSMRSFCIDGACIWCSAVTG